MILERLDTIGGLRAFTHGQHALFGLVDLAIHVLVDVAATMLVIDMTRSLNHFWISIPALIAVAAWRVPGVWNVTRLRHLGALTAITCMLLPSTECYLAGTPTSPDGTGGKMVLLGMFKPLPMRVAAWVLGIPQG